MLIELKNPRPNPAAAGAMPRKLTAVAPLTALGAAVDFRSVVPQAGSNTAARHAPKPAAVAVPVTTPHASEPAPEPDPDGRDFLAELEQEVRSLPVTPGPDRETLERNARLANSACRAARDYWTRLVEHLNALKPCASGRYLFDGRTVLERRPSQNFRVVANVRTSHTGEEHYESVTLSWRVGGSERMKMLKEFPVEIERLRRRLTFACINAFESQSRDADTGRHRGTQFEFTADVNASVRITTLHDEGKIRLTLLNLDALERIEADFPAFAIRPSMLDDIARLICGRANNALKHAQNIVRHEP